MAFDQGTIQALEVLDRTLARRSADVEADKRRASQLVELKIRQDEREADRLTQRLINIENQNLRMQEEFTKLTGLASQVQAIENDPNYEGEGGAAALVGAKQANMAMDRNSLQQRITEALDERATVLGRLGTYYDAFNRLAPEQFERHVAAGADQTLTGISTIGDDEFQLVREDLERQGIAITPEREAGLRRSFQALGEKRFEQELEEEKLRLQNLLLRLRASAKRGGKDTEAREFGAGLRERISRLNKTAASFGVEDNIDLTIPLTSQSTFGEIGLSAAMSFANFAVRGDRVDLFDTPKEMRNLLSEFKKSTGREREQVALEIMNLVSTNPTKFTQGFDFTGTNLFGRSAEFASGEPQFLGELFEIFSAVNAFEAERFFADPSAQEALQALDTAPGAAKPEVPAEEDTGFFDFLGNTFNTILQDLDVTTKQAHKKAGGSLIDRAKRKLEELSK